ncbi:MAG: hypothetical protein LBI91_08575 [Spirochaetaceae bacterium]|jgi:hypothetical protein|nr:hypothetical protein [Spirochaetaceae bacterium]
MGKKRIIIPAAVVLVLAAAWLGISSFLSRAPVLVVEDRVFESIYGPFRLRKKQFLLSLGLKRPLRVVRIEENAGDDVAVFTVESAAENPYCVIFAARYYGAARRYSQEYPEIPVGVFRGRGQDPGLGDGEGLKIIRTDQKLDLYRAGRLAALLVPAPPPPEEGAALPEERVPVILVFQDEYISNDQRDAFKKGLEDEGNQSRPRYLIGSSQYQSGMPCDAAVIYGAAPGFSELPGEIPGLLFSWIDPGLTPRKVKAVFDDSPLALAPELVPLITETGNDGDNNGKILEIPSEIQILSRRLAEKQLLEKMKSAAGAELP